MRVAGDTNWILSSAVPADATIEAVRSVIVDASQFEDKLNQVIPAVYSMRRRLENLKHHLSRLDVQVSRLRVAVRQSELDTKAVLQSHSTDAIHCLNRSLNYRELASN